MYLRAFFVFGGDFVLSFRVTHDTLTRAERYNVSLDVKKHLQPSPESGAEPSMGYPPSTAADNADPPGFGFLERTTANWPRDLAIAGR